MENKDTQSFWNNDFEAAAAIEFLYNDSLISREISRNIRLAYLRNFTVDGSVVPEFGQVSVFHLKNYSHQARRDLARRCSDPPVLLIHESSHTRLQKYLEE